MILLGWKISQNIQFIWVLREANGAAHYLATWSLGSAPQVFFDAVIAKQALVGKLVGNSE